ncbi:MAG: hypothetical protein WDZ91_05250 [Paenibacillaceae bacterium]
MRKKLCSIGMAALLLIAITGQAFATDYTLDNDDTKAWGSTENNNSKFSLASCTYCWFSDVRYATPVSTATGSYRWIFLTQSAGAQAYYIYSDNRNTKSKNTAASYYIGSTFQRTIDQSLSTGTWYSIWSTTYQGSGVYTTVKVSNESTDTTNTIGADAAQMVGP